MKYLHTEKIKILSNGALLVTLVIFCIVTQLEYDAANKPFTNKFEAVNRTLFPASALKYLSFGFNNVLADMYWVRTIQDLIQWNEKDQFYVDYFKNISTLDPKFEYPYLFGVFVVPTNKSPQFLEQIAIVADRGIQALPENWQIPFYLSTKYKLITQDFNKTEYYLNLAASRDSAPEAVHLVNSAFAGNKTKIDDFTRAMIKIIYDTTDNETIKKLAAKGILINDLNTSIQKAIARYKLTYKTYPINLFVLEQSNLISLPDVVKNAFTLEINKDGTFRLVEKVSKD